MPQKIIVIEDQPVFLYGLLDGLQKSGLFVWKHFNSRTVLDKFKMIEQSDVIIMNSIWQFGSAEKFLERCLQKQLQTSVVIYSTTNDMSVLHRLTKRKVAALISRWEPVEQLVEIINNLDGVSFQISNLLAPLYAEFVSMNVIKKEKVASLTISELELLHQVGDFKTNKEISDSKKVGLKTVENQKYKIQHKLSLSGRGALMRFALDHKEEIIHALTKKRENTPKIEV